MARFKRLLTLLLLIGMGVFSPAERLLAVAAKDATVPFEAHLARYDDQGLTDKVPEAHPALAQGAKIYNLPHEKTFMVVWFPLHFQKHPVRRTLFVLHGANGNAYQGVLQQLEMARKYDYGLVSLQWTRGGESYLQAPELQSLLAGVMPFLVQEFGVEPNRIGLETANRSASLSYELAYWDKVKGAPSFQLIIAESGGLLPEDLQAGCRSALLGKMSRGELGPTPLAGNRFFLYCGQKEQESPAQKCENVRTAKTFLESQGGTVVRLIEDPLGRQGTLHERALHFQASVEAFLAATR